MFTENQVSVQFQEDIDLLIEGKVALACTPSVVLMEPGCRGDVLQPGNHG